MGAGLFPTLLGASFEQLDPPVREVHGGNSTLLRGTARIERGRSLMARALCTLTSLPQSTPEVAVDVQITAKDQTERWTRYFGDCRPMRSTLTARGGFLIEQLGPAKFAFRLRAHDGGIDWSLARVTALGIPLPRSWFAMSACSGARAHRYRFVVDVAVFWVGQVIRYEGELDVITIS